MAILQPVCHGVCVYSLFLQGHIHCFPSLILLFPMCVLWGDDIPKQNWWVVCWGKHYPQTYIHCLTTYWSLKQLLPCSAVFWNDVTMCGVFVSPPVCVHVWHSFWKSIVVLVAPEPSPASDDDILVCMCAFPSGGFRLLGFSHSIVVAWGSPNYCCMYWGIVCMS